MNQVSTAGIGMYALIAEGLLHVFGITPEPGSVLAVINAAGTILAFVLWLVGQLNRKDLHFGLVRKSV